MRDKTLQLPELIASPAQVETRAGQLTPAAAPSQGT